MEREGGLDTELLSADNCDFRTSKALVKGLYLDNGGVTGVGLTRLGGDTEENNDDDDEEEVRGRFAGKGTDGLADPRRAAAGGKGNGGLELLAARASEAAAAVWR